MAILHEIPGIEVNVQVNRQPLEEYDDDEEYQPQPGIREDRRAVVKSKYIKSVTGEQFTVNIIVGSRYVLDCGSLQFIIQVDGIDICSYHLNKSQYDPDRPWKYAVRGRKSTDLENKTHKLEPFQFSKLETDESRLAQVEEDTELVKEVGEIIVSVYRKSESIKKEHARDDVKTEPDSKTLVPKSKSAKKAHKCHNNTRPEIKPLPAVHEKALKGSAKSHTTSYGPEKVTKITEPRNWSWSPSKYLDGRNYPMAIFRFKYRSEKALKQLLILKRTPEPDRPSPDLEPEVQSRNSLDQNALKDKVKHERDQTGNEGRGPSKRARKSIVIVEEIDVIDLTGD